MFAFLSKFFLKNHIDLFAPIPLSDCKVQREYLLEREGIQSGTAIMLAVPYFTKACQDPKRNLSCYAVSKDYHGYFKSLCAELLPLLREKFPNNRFGGFADHSPVCEVDAAARAGLGIIGKNHLLITEKYSSFVFLGCLITDAVLNCEAHEPAFCENCGACIRACPASSPSDCLSALTQKKGALSEEERRKILCHGSVWGCDICQLVCPHTQQALKQNTIFSPIPYFEDDTLPHLTVEKLDEMSDDDFLSRAYAWRGKDTVRRNLLLFEELEKKGEP
ncbi:MAG: epoxyqueuosine reductase [Clostridia bacterium]|nr:epoxyqueuosine reductase [Clostridia bacterium]